MRNALIFFIAVLIVQFAEAQNVTEKDVVGKILFIKAPKGHSFNHLNFPRLNFIIKKRGIANYKSVYDNRVKITASEQLEDGNTRVYLKRTNGRKFFNYLPEVAANLELALQSGELVQYEP